MRELMQLPVPDKQTDQLLGLFSTVDSRVERIIKKRPDWPCHKGCDQCCRELAEPPTLTAAEWNLLHEGLQQLRAAQQQRIGDRILELIDDTGGRLTCPFLDRANGECLVYNYRPAMCRMYGFYVSGMHNLWCQKLQVKYESGAFDDVILGNHAPVERSLQQYGGVTRSLIDWYQSTTYQETENEDTVC